jgi:hypothetical protein
MGPISESSGKAKDDGPRHGRRGPNGATSRSLLFVIELFSRDLRSGAKMIE